MSCISGFKCLDKAIIELNEHLKLGENAFETDFGKKLIKLGNELSLMMDRYYLEIDNMYDDYRTRRDEYDSLKRERQITDIRNDVIRLKSLIHREFELLGFMFVFEDIIDPTFQ